MLLPEDIKTKLTKRYPSSFSHWLADAGEWPIKLGLKPGSEEDTFRHLDRFREWTKAWSNSENGLRVVYKTVNWHRLGKQTIPIAVEFSSAEAISQFIAKDEHWQTMLTRKKLIQSRFTQLSNECCAKAAALTQNLLADDFKVLIDLCLWSESPRPSPCYQRQIPVRGMDTKWLDRHQGVFKAIMGLITVKKQANLSEILNIIPRPLMMDIAWLDPYLRSQFGNLRLMSVSVDEIRKIPIREQIKNVFICENKESGIALPDLPETLAIFGLGYKVKILQQIPWLSGIPLTYWGDIDTHGLAILSQLRETFPQIKSVLMDLSTLESCQDLWTIEDKQFKGDVKFLDEEEEHVFELLQSGALGVGVRLEQERVPWHLVTMALMPLQDP